MNEMNSGIKRKEATAKTADNGAVLALASEILEKYARAFEELAK